MILAHEKCKEICSKPMIYTHFFFTTNIFIKRKCSITTKQQKLDYLQTKSATNLMHCKVKSSGQRK